MGLNRLLSWLKIRRSTRPSVGEPERNDLPSESEAGPSRIRQAGWRQGSALKDAHVRALVTSGNLSDTVGKDNLIVLVSHDCDILSNDYQKEPMAEVALGRLVTHSQRDGNLSWGKNPRALQIDLPPGMIVEFQAHQRIWIDRSLLEEDQPDAARSLDTESTQLLARWLAKRYFRAALPDNFNSRIAPVTSEVRTLLKQQGKDLTAIFLTVSDAELEPGTSYVIELRSTMRTDHYEEEVALTRAQRVTDTLADLLNGCEGVDVADAVVLPESAVSLDDMRLLKAFDQDDLSLRVHGGEDLAPA